jgi:hypothetical protein
MWLIYLFFILKKDKKSLTITIFSIPFHILIIFFWSHKILPQFVFGVVWLFYFLIIFSFGFLENQKTFNFVFF